MTDCAANRGEFQSWGRQPNHRRELFSRLVACASRYVAHCSVFSVDVTLWESFNQRFELEEIWGKPNVLASLCAISSAITHSTESRELPIEFVFEEGDEHVGQLERKALELFGVRVRIQSKAGAIACQVADMVAWKQRRVLTNAVSAEPGRDRTKDDQQLDQLLRSLATLDPIPITSRAFVDAETMTMWCASTGVPQRLDPLTDTMDFRLERS